MILAVKGWYILDWSFEDRMESDTEFGVEVKIRQGVYIVCWRLVLKFEDSPGGDVQFCAMCSSALTWREFAGLLSRL